MEGDCASLIAKNPLLGSLAPNTSQKNKFNNLSLAFFFFLLSVYFYSTTAILTSTLSPLLVRHRVWTILSGLLV